MPKQKTIGVVITSKNRDPFLAATLALFTHPDYSVYIHVSFLNDKPDETMKYFLDNMSKVLVSNGCALTTSNNTGSIAANRSKMLTNMKTMGLQYVLMLDNDVMFTPDTIKSLIDGMQEDTHIVPPICYTAPFVDVTNERRYKDHDPSKIYLDVKDYEAQHPKTTGHPFQRYRFPTDLPYCTTIGLWDLHHTYMDELLNFWALYPEGKRGYDYYGSKMMVESGKARIRMIGELRTVSGICGFQHMWTKPDDTGYFDMPFSELPTVITLDIHDYLDILEVEELREGNYARVCKAKKDLALNVPQTSIMFVSTGLESVSALNSDMVKNDSSLLCVHVKNLSDYTNFEMILPAFAAILGFNKMRPTGELDFPGMEPLEKTEFFTPQFIVEKYTPQINLKFLESPNSKLCKYELYKIAVENEWKCLSSFENDIKTTDQDWYTKMKEAYLVKDQGNRITDFKTFVFRTFYEHTFGDEHASCNPAELVVSKETLQRWVNEVEETMKTGRDLITAGNYSIMEADLLCDRLFTTLPVIKNNLG